MTRVSPGSTTTDPAAWADRPRRNRHRLRFRRPHRIEQFGARDEHDAGARHGQQDARIARIDFEVMAAAFDRAHGNRINDEERLEPGLDDEQAGEAFEHDYG
jgi:hypothetical protein